MRIFATPNGVIDDELNFTFIPEENWCNLAIDSNICALRRRADRFVENGFFISVDGLSGETQFPDIFGLSNGGWWNRTFYFFEYNNSVYFIYIDYFQNPHQVSLYKFPITELGLNLAEKTFIVLETFISYNGYKPIISRHINNDKLYLNYCDSFFNNLYIAAGIREINLSTFSIIADTPTNRTTHFIYQNKFYNLTSPTPTSLDTTVEIRESLDGIVWNESSVFTDTFIGAGVYEFSTYLSTIEFINSITYNNEVYILFSYNLNSGYKLLKFNGISWEYVTNTITNNTDFNYVTMINENLGIIVIGYENDSYDSGYYYSKDSGNTWNFKIITLGNETPWFSASSIAKMKPFSNYFWTDFKDTTEYL